MLPGSQTEIIKVVELVSQFASIHFDSASLGDETPIPNFQVRVCQAIVALFAPKIAIISHEKLRKINLLRMFMNFEIIAIHAV